MISTIDSESTSRSSVKDLSSWTSSVGTPETSLTISARSLRTSSVVGIWALSFGVDLAACGSCWDGDHAEARSRPWEVVRVGRRTDERSGQEDDLSGIDQACAETDDQ